MAKTFTAVIKNEDNWWIGWIEEVPGVNCQEKTLGELRKTLKATLKEALVFNRREALRAADSDYSEEILTV
jgi:predicted RNase H-like HicB family nuclease